MAEKTYVVQATRFGHLRNREQVEKAAEEGRTIPPVVDYLEQGARVKLDSSHPATEKAVANGSIAEPGAVEAQRREELKAELERLDAQKAQLEAQANADAAADASPEELKGQDLDDALEAAGLPKTGSADEKRERLAAAQSA